MTAPEASVVISTFNRADALAETLAAFAKQDLAPNSYEVIVVDDGSTDDTWTQLETMSTPYKLRTVRHECNRGVSAGRNSGIRLAQGRTLIFVSDDVLVPPSFVRQHVETVERMPGYWVVGAFRQRHSTSATPFGRYLENLERGFSRGRTAGEIAPGLWEMTWPTARNLSLPRSDLDRIGLFDERFRTTCEDQDLAQRARQVGVHFVYSEEIDCIHNDHVAYLARYSDFQQRGARDGPLLCAKYPLLHGRSSLARENGPIRRSDGPKLVAKKVGKLVCSTPVPMAMLRRIVRILERIHAPRRVVETGYRWVIALAIFSGWRQGLQEAQVAFGRRPGERMGGDGFALSTYLHPAAKRLEPHLEHLGTALLRRRLTRETLNFAYERGGTGFAAGRLPRAQRVRRANRVRMVGRLRRRRVSSACDAWNQASWSNALYWRWSAAQPIRRSYEWYLERHSLSSASPVYLDIGANDGMHTYPFAARGWACVAFEPQDSCVTYLRESCRLNRFHDVTIERTAVGDRTAPAVEFFVSRSTWYSSLDRASVERFEPAERVSVPLVTIDDYCDANGLRPRCLKIDVEGAELAVLRGATATLTSARPDLFIEVAADVLAKRELWQMLRDLGYDFYAIGFGDEHLGRLARSLNEFLSIGNEQHHCDYMLLPAHRGAIPLSHPRSNTAP